MNYNQTDAAALAVMESLVREWLPAGRKEGHEWKVGSLSGEPGRSLSINLTTGVWKDFAGDAGGPGAVSLLAAIRNITLPDACRELDARIGIQSTPPASTSDKWTPIPATGSAPLPSFRHPRLGDPSAIWTYRDAKGDHLGHICRFDHADGKDILPLTYCQSGNRREWRWLSMGKPRPLYGLDLLAANPTAGVLIVEGEKAADAARTIAPGVVVTWPGGSKAVRHADWTPLKGRRVLVWPDRDQPGREAASAIQAALKGVAAKVRVLNPPDGPDDGWDAADAIADGWDAQRFHQWVASIPTAAEPPPEPPPGYEAEPTAWVPTFRDDRIGDMPFRLLGMDGDAFLYMPDSGQQLVSLTASGHTKPNLMRLAPLNSWEDAFGDGDELAGKDWDKAINALIQRSQRLPKFDPRRIRGRGCWIDGPDVVFHAGGSLIVNGTDTPIPSYDSHIRAIYEGSLEIPTPMQDCLSNKDASRIIELCEMLSWERPLYGKLLSGWLALAPVCGALAWRPHLWVTGPSGSGKSWTVSNIIQPLVGDTAVHVQGNTSEAGIRQALGSDALPVVFDEAESEDRPSQARFDKVLELARQASTETGAGIVKGSATGGAVTYLIRSMFLFASIGVAAVKKADVSRVTVLPLRKNTGPFAQADFDEIKRVWRETIGQPKFAERFRARSLKHAMVIRANAETFSTVAVEFTGDKRSADQIGTLLSGAYSLTSVRPIDADDARAFMARQDWSGFRSEDVDNDENQCLAHLFAAVLAFDDRGHQVRRSVDEVIREIRSIPDASPDSDLDRRHELGHALIRHGIRLAEGRLYVANRHQQLERIYSDTAWAGAKWRTQLERVPGAQKHDVMSFGGLVRQRAVSLPVA